MNVCVCVCTYMCLGVFVNSSVYMNACFICIYAQLYLSVCICQYVYECTYLKVYVYVYMCGYLSKGEPSRLSILGIIKVTDRILKNNYSISVPWPSMPVLLCLQQACIPNGRTAAAAAAQTQMCGPQRNVSVLENWLMLLTSMWLGFYSVPGKTL